MITIPAGALVIDLHHLLHAGNASLPLVVVTLDNDNRGGLLVNSDADNLADMLDYIETLHQKILSEGDPKGYLADEIDAVTDRIEDLT